MISRISCSHRDLSDVLSISFISNLCSFRWPLLSLTRVLNVGLLFDLSIVAFHLGCQLGVRTKRECRNDVVSVCSSHMEPLDVTTVGYTECERYID